MKRTFYLKRETDGARLLQTADGLEFWVPRSVCPTTLKYPPDSQGRRPVNVEIEDWWWEKNGMDAKCAGQAKLKI